MTVGSFHTLSNYFMQTIFVPLKTQEDSQRRKDEMKEAESRRRTNTKLNDLEQEAKDKANVLLTRANRLRLEQEDEIKGLNEVRGSFP